MALVRIFSVDFYMSLPMQGMDIMYNDFRGSSVHQVPIIRIFGSSELGCKTCLHIHGVFPYIYIPFEGSEHSSSVIYQVATKLDKAINTAIGQASSNTQHIYKIVPVSGIPFYGYHSEEHQFLKIYFYNPVFMKKACNLLHNENILGKIYQLHEGHIPFVLQFMIDYNLHGMNYISLSQVYYRVNPDTPKVDIPVEFLLPANISKTSTCQIEGDGLAEHIVNRLEVAVGQVVKNPGITALWDDEKQRLRNKNENSEISQCISQTRINTPPTDSHVRFKTALKENLSLKVSKSCSADQSALVYPTETPKTNNILSASLVETHFPTNCESSSYSVECTPEIDLNNRSVFDKTFSNSSLNNSVANDLLEVLQDLGDHVNAETDSILSQVSKYPDESDEEYETDMSLPLAAVTTPTKIIADINIENYDDQTTNNENENMTGSENASDGNSLNLGCQKEQVDTDLNKIVESNAHMQNSSYNFTNNSTHTVLEHVFDKVKRQLSFMEMDITPLNKDTKVNFLNQNVTAEDTQSDGDSLSKFFEAKYFALTNINASNSQYHSEHTAQYCDFSNFHGNKNQSSEELLSEKMHTDVNKYETDTKRVLTENKFDRMQKNNSKNLFSKAEEYDMDGNYLCIAGTSKENECFETKEFCMKSKQISVSEHLPLLLNHSQNSTSVSFTPYSKCSEQIFQCDSLNKREHSIDKQTLPNTLKINSAVPLSQKVKFIQNLSILEGFSLNNGCNVSKVLMPKFNPPSKEVIKLTLQEYDIPEKKHQTPFYSDFADVTGEVQIGYNILKIESTTSGLLDFECRVVNQGLQELRKLEMQKIHPGVEITHNKVKRTKLSFCENVNCILTVSKLPPTRLEINLFLKVRKTKEKCNKVIQKREKLKILMPCSSGEDNDSDNGDYITLSPLCPVDDSTCEVTKSENNLQQTPKKSFRKKEQIVNKNCKFKQISQSKCQKRKSVKQFNEFCENKTCPVNSIYDNDATLRKSLLQSQFLNHFSSSSEVAQDSCQITGATANNTHGFKLSLENLQKAKTISEHQGLTVLVVEIHIQTRSDFKPDPQLDSIRAIFYSLFSDVPESTIKSTNITGIIAVDLPSSNINKTGASMFEGSGITCDTIYVDSETNLINEFVKLVRFWDPDICAGYEIEQLSWGYLIDRGYVLGINLQLLLARTAIKLSFTDDEFHSDLKLTGRVLLNAWRLMRHEIALQSYTFENVMYHVLHVRIPLYSFKDLSFWWEHNSSIYRHRTANFYLCRVEGILKLFGQLDLIGRTCELARLFGIQFYEVLSRGSQFRVESMMLRLAKPLNYIAVSPSVQQRAKMKAPESLPLILEPESKFFTDPVIVLDFQSLYPSIIIAYNYCFSTCLGRVEHLGQNVPFEFGATQLKISNAKLKRLLHKNLLNFSPCGVAFVKAQVRQGILPRMLLEILEARLMVKKSMKQNKDDKLLQRVLHSRQLGLKLIANVTYGYTAANFSGRMPAVEIGDSVVSKGRETLLRAIKLIENTPCWGAKVVYGDTDSVFVLVSGRSRQCAFKIGTEIAEAVTNANPSPVKLKLEKVYQPCILQTKKRYVGYAYESAEQTEPEFCAKGIETVRRDGCPAVSKMLEKCLKILFDTRDVSLVRKYVVRQFSKLLTGRVSLQDLTFAKEYRGAANYKPGACVPALELTRKWLTVDKRNEPRCGERVPYVIVNGPPGLPLIKLVRSPREMLSSDSNLLPNVLYYITRVIIPPLNRCFTLIGVDLNTWFNNMPRKQMQILNNVTPDSTSKKRAISHYFSIATCIACSQQAQHGLCVECCNSPQETVAILQNKIRFWEQSYSAINQICGSCCGHSKSITCISLDCPVMYSITTTNKDFQQASYVRQIVSTSLNLDI